MLLLLALQNRVGTKMNLGIAVSFPKGKQIYARVFTLYKNRIPNLNATDFVFILLLYFSSWFLPLLGYQYVAHENHSQFSDFHIELFADFY